MHWISGTFPAPSARLGVPSALATSTRRPLPVPEVLAAAGAARMPTPAPPGLATAAPPDGSSGIFCWQVLKTARHEANVAVQLYRSTIQSRYPSLDDSSVPTLGRVKVFRGASLELALQKSNPPRHPISPRAPASRQSRNSQIHSNKVLSPDADDPWASLGLLIPGTGLDAGGRALLACTAFKSPGVRSDRPALAAGGVSGTEGAGLSLSPRRPSPPRFTAFVLAWFFLSSTF